MAGENNILPPASDENIQFDPAVIGQRVNAVVKDVKAVTTQQTTDTTAISDIVSGATPVPVASHTHSSTPVAYWNAPVVKTGKWLPAAWANLTAVNTSIINNSSNRGAIFWIPFIFPTAMTVDAVAFNVTVANANTKVRSGLYTDADGRPDTLVIDNGQTSMSTTGIKTVTLATPYAVSAGKRLWGALVLQDSTTTTAAMSGITANYAPWKYQDNPGSALGAGNASNPAFYTSAGLYLSTLPANTSSGGAFFVDSVGTGLSYSPNMTLRMA